MKKKKPYQITQKEFKERLDLLRNCCAIQNSKGNYDFSPYMHGFANGLIMALSLMEDDDPKFIDRIDQYLCDIDVKLKGKNNVKSSRSRRRKRKA